MEATREIYWNIGHGVVLPMYLLAFAACGIMVWGFWQRLPVWRQGKALNRFDRYDERVKRMIADAFGQIRVSRVIEGGLFHSLFFWGFLTLFAGTLLVMLQADFFTPLLQINILSGGSYRAFSLALDLAGLAAILMLAGLFIRRFVTQPKGLEIVNDDYIVHILLFTILISGFLIEGARMAATELQQNPGLAIYSPVGYLVAQLFLSVAPDALPVVHKILWWLHLVLALGFIAAIPYTKLRHIFTTAANYFFVDLGPKGALVTVDMEGDAESFGVAGLKDLTWKDIFDTDACTKCKRCQDRCPAHNTDKPLSPMKMISQLGEVACSNPEANLIETVSKDALWSCTTCRACQEICPAAIEQVNKIVDMRRNLVLMEGEFPGDEVVTAMGNTEVNGNPFGMAFAARGDWAEGLPVKRLADDSDVDILYFVGCYASFDKRNIKVASSFVQLCEKAGIKVGILGKEEKCCGEPMRKMGNEYLYQSLAAENIETIKGYGVKKIVTACPHCFNTLAKDYRDLGLDIEVEHYTVYLNRLQQDGKLKLKADRFDCTYHDSCYIGRYNDLYQEPRALLAAAGGSIREMEKSQAESFCCGAGGGRIMAEEKLGSRISESRAKMAAETGSDMLVSNCPFCLTMFEDGIKGAELEGRLVPRDIAEILLERVEA